MSTLASWSYTNVATIWPNYGTDEYGRPSFGAPYTVACTWADTGETQRDEAGVEFVPKSTFWAEFEYGGTTPLRGDYIAKFDLTGEPDPVAAGASPLRKVTSWDMTPFGNETPDWALFT